LDDREAADARELVNHDVAGDERPILHFDVSTEQRAVDQRHVVADHAVVGDVSVTHDQVVVADRRHARALHRAAMDLGVFTDRVAIADHQTGRLSFVTHVLRFVSDDRERMDHVVGAHLGVSRDMNESYEPCSRTDLGRTVDDDTGSDFDVRGDFGATIDDCGGVNQGGTSRETESGNEAVARSPLAVRRVQPSRRQINDSRPSVPPNGARRACAREPRSVERAGSGMQDFRVVV
jgi:hypothetical protein